MSESPFQPARRFSPEIERCLFELAEQRMVLPARQAGYELQCVGVTALPESPMEVVTTENHGTWLFAEPLHDPTTKQYQGKIPIPDIHLDRLRTLSQAPVRPDLVWVAHEVPDGYKQGDPLVPSPRHLREKDERLRLLLAHAWNAWRTAIAGLFAVTAAPALAPVAVAGVMGVGSDPVILGGVKHPSVPAVSWYVLAQWDWE